MDNQLVKREVEKQEERRSQALQNKKLQPIKRSHAPPKYQRVNQQEVGKSGKRRELETFSLHYSSVTIRSKQNKTEGK